MHQKKRRMVIIAVLMARLMSAPGINADDAVQRETKSKIVIAHCMACNSIACADPAGNQDKLKPEGVTFWQNPVGEELPEMVQYTRDPLGSAREEIRLARESGIDAFGIFNNGYIIQSNFSKQTEAYWQAAVEDGKFKLYPEIWTLDNEEYLNKTIKELQLLKDKYDSAWLRVNGKRMLFFATDKGLVRNGALDTKTLERLLEPVGGRKSVYLSILASCKVPGYGFQPPPGEWLREADAINYWWALSYGDDLAMMPAMDAYARETGKDLWIRAVPSFFQLRPNVGPVITERLGMAGYYANWMHIIREQPAIASITTWNDWTEDSAAMPNTHHDRVYEELTRYFSTWYKTGRTPGVEKEKVLLFHHPQLTEVPVNLPTGCKSCVRYNWHATPPTDYVGVVAMLKQPASIKVELGNGSKYEMIAERCSRAGVTFWLIYHPLANAADSAIKNGDAHTPTPRFSPVYPEEQKDFFVTKLSSALKDRNVYVGVNRNGNPIGYFRSHAPVRTRPRPISVPLAMFFRFRSNAVFNGEVSFRVRRADGFQFNRIPMPRMPGSARHENGSLLRPLWGLSHSAPHTQGHARSSLHPNGMGRGLYDWAARFAVSFKNTKYSTQSAATPSTREWDWAWMKWRTPAGSCFQPGFAFA